MNKCPDCHNCSDNKHCDKFYISEQYSVTIVVEIDEEGLIIFKSQFFLEFCSIMEITCEMFDI